MSKRKYTFKSICIDWLFQDIALIQKIFLNEPLFSRSELLWRSILEILLIVSFYLIFSFLGFTYAIMIGILIAHTSNWIFNGHGGMIFLRILKETLKSIRLSYIKDLRKRLESRNIIAVIYGSMCRNEDNIHSDIDVYVINTGGTLNGLKCSFFNSVERMRAVVRGIPLDIYCIDSIEHLKRRISIWQKEKYFLILSDPLGVIRNCPDIPTKRLEDLA